MRITTGQPPFQTIQRGLNAGIFYLKHDTGRFATIENSITIPLRIIKHQLCQSYFPGQQSFNHITHVGFVELTGIKKLEILILHETIKKVKRGPSSTKPFADVSSGVVHDGISHIMSAHPVFGLLG
jgi:hypothetical protein